MLKTVTALATLMTMIAFGSHPAAAHAHHGRHLTQARFHRYSAHEFGWRGRERIAHRWQGGRRRFAAFAHHRRRSLFASASTTSVAAAAPSSGSGGGFAQTGRASFYSSAHRTANGSRVGWATCAHRSLPFGTKVLVTNLSNSRQAVLTVNDRGPFVRGRVIDVSRGAAGTLGMLQAGTANIRLEVLSRHG